MILLSQVELSLSADGGRSVVLFLSELFKGAESDSGECVESRSRVVNYRCVEFPRLSNIDSFYDTIYVLTCCAFIDLTDFITVIDVFCHFQAAETQR